MLLKLLEAAFEENSISYNSLSRSICMGDALLGDNSFMKRPDKTYSNIVTYQMSDTIAGMIHKWPDKEPFKSKQYWRRYSP